MLKFDKTFHIQIVKESLTFMGNVSDFVENLQGSKKDYLALFIKFPGKLGK